MSIRPPPPTLTTWGQETPSDQCNGRFKGRRLSPKVLSAILADHEAWVKDEYAKKVQPDAPDARRVNLGEADLRSANLQGAFFEPLSDALPVIASAARADGLAAITFSLPFAAVELREAFKKAGLPEQQHQLIRAINYTLTRQGLDPERKKSSSERIEAAFKWLMFEPTCEYGWYPGRPLRILGASL